MRSDVIRVGVPRLAAFAALLVLWLSFTARAAELVEVVKMVENSVVQVDTDRGFGSGVIVDNRGWVLTNYHVIERARKATVTMRSGKVFEVRGFLAIDPLRDLALLKTDEFAGPCAMKLAPKLPEVGEKVAAFGNPKGFSFTTSEGIVSAKRSGTEVMTIIGRTAYAMLGYAADAMWVQTTAPISAGNSGGPLVNMNAELVGLNTWSHLQGQNLNFAISLEDITRLLGRDLSAGPQDLATLPNLRGKPVRPDDGKPLELTLPTGRVFSFDIFMIEGENLQRWVALDKDDGSVVWRHPNGAVFAAAQQRGGVLNGETIAQYENREPMVYVNYVDGKRHGILKTWDEAGQPRLFAQYLAGRRNGFTCFFDDDDLALIAQYKNDELEYLQLMDGSKALQGFKSESEALQHPKPKALLAQLDKFEQMLKKNEVEFRKRVRDFETDRRRELASQLSPIKRQRIAERGKQRAAQNAALHQELYRRAVGAR
jgi:S1-C subfamily serine protease